MLLSKVQRIFFVCVLVFMEIASSSKDVPKLLGSFSISNPAFVTLYENPAAVVAKDKYDLIISTFNPVPFTTDTVSAVKRIGQYVGDVKNIVPETLTTKTTWPNEAAGVPGKYMYISFQRHTLLNLRKPRILTEL